MRKNLKNSINYYLNLPSGEKNVGIITVDSDGQHITKDVVAVAKTMSLHPNDLILGCRNFSSNESVHVPWKSYFGNKTTSMIFQLLFGKKIHDTQTGLRGIPKSLMPNIIDLAGERFEYEINMLIYTVKHNISIQEVGIQTVYMNNNEETHFHPIKDSFKIYSLMFSTFFKYMLTSLSSFLIDILLFQLFVFLLKDIIGCIYIICATILARIISSFFNFLVNKNIVFQQTNDKNGKCLLRYYCLCIVQMLISAGLVSFIYKICPVSESLIKIIVDSLLFFISFHIQQAWVFKINN